MSYQIAIPTSNRSDRIGDMTLKLLREGGVDMGCVTLWVPDETQAKAYKDVAQKFGVGITSGHGMGMAAARNAIARGYPIGTRLVELDDDIRSILLFQDSKTLVDAPSIHEIILRAHRETPDGCLWCVYPVPNPFFMQKDRVRRKGLWYAEGAWFGYTVYRDDSEIVHTDDKEDFERSCRMFLRDGRVVRLDDVTYRTKFYKEPGGMQDFRTAKTIEAGARYVARTYPGLASLRVKSDGRYEIKLDSKGKMK